jgi:cysteine synthase
MAEVWVKVEGMNPGGSIKDRTALAMITDAERRGLLRPGGTIVEPTSGNTGIGLAQVASARGYRLVLCLPASMSEERKTTLLAYGAELVLTDPERRMLAAIEEAERIRARDRRLLPQPVRQPREPGGPLPDHRPGDLGGDGGAHRRLRLRHRHRRHHLRRGPLPEGADPNIEVVAVEPAAPRCCTASRAGSTSSRGWGRASSPRTSTAPSSTG